MAATDYTELSENAVRTASALCRKHDAELVLFHVVENAVAFDEHHLDLDYLKELKNFSRSQMRSLGDKIRKEYQVKVSEIVSYGDVVKEIINAAQDAKPDLILAGMHGTSGFRRFFIGSTAYRLIKHTKFPVLTVPGEGDWTVFKNILFPVRLIPGALEKYDHIRPILRQDKSLLHVLGLTRDSSGDKLTDIVDLEHKLEARLNKDGVDFEMSYDHCHNYAECILETAEKKMADLIVISATLEFAFREFFIGPFSQQIISHAKVPVLCIRTE